MLSHGSAPPEPGWLPDEVVSAVLLAVDYNLADVRVLTQACLALGNVGRADPTLCRRVMFDGGLQSLSSAMKAFHWDSGLQVAAISALAVALASVPDSRLHVLTEHVPLLDLVLSTADSFLSSAIVQQYVCAFCALLLTEGLTCQKHVVLSTMVTIVLVLSSSVYANRRCSHAACAGSCCCCHGNPLT